MAIKLGTSTPSKLYVGSTEVTKAYLGASEVYSSAPALDPDAQAYITAVETADGQALEPVMITAINNFVVGCKADGIWNAIKASSILAGARTLAGALVPLVGTAPTNFNFVSGDYDRKTGLKGDGITKYLDSNRANNSDPATNKHLATFSTQHHTRNTVRADAGCAGSSPGGTNLLTTSSARFYRVNWSANTNVSDTSTQAGFWGASRNNENNTDGRYGGTDYVINDSVNGSISSLTIKVFSRDTSYSDARLSFYSTGESLDLALLDTRVSALMTAIDGAIP